MNILYELGLQGRGTLMLIPTNMPTAGAGSTQTTGSIVPPYGVMGLREIQEMASTPKPTSPSAQNKGNTTQ